MNKKLLRKKLALMLATLKKKRPFYTEVEYLESTGTQYIDTGVDAKTGLTIEAKIKYVSHTGIFCGAITTSAGTGDRYYAINFSQQNKVAFTYLDTAFTGSTNLTAGNIYTIKTVLGLTRQEIFVDGVSKGYTTKTDNVDLHWTLGLFALHRGVSFTPEWFSESKAILYYCKIWDGDTLVRDMIPVLDWNMTPCMYDRVTEQLFYNKGTGSFVAGRQIHPVDYLESTGVEYIDTGIKFDGANTKIELKTYEDSLTRRHSICGDNGNFFYYFRGTGSWAVGYNGTAANIDLYMSVGNNVFIIDKNNVYINGVLAKTYTATSKISSYNTLLFNRKTNLVDNGAVTMYYCKIWNNDVLVRDYIPAIDENGVGYMFDRVSHTIYDNAGQGAFKYPAREVEYLESDGARAIVAGVTVDDTCGYDVKWMALNADDRIIMGTKGSGDSRWALSGSNNPNINLSWNTIYRSNGLGLNKIQTAQMNYFNDRKRILNDTPLEDITQTLSTYASTYNVGIFAGYWGATTISLYSTCRIYYVKISKGTELIRDFIPMIKDGSPCLYDKVGGEYYFGIGTGSFSKGKIVEPEYE